MKRMTSLLVAAILCAGCVSPAATDATLATAEIAPQTAAASPAPTPDPKEKLAYGAKTNVIFDKGGVQIAW